MQKKLLLKALAYLDSHLDETLNLDLLAQKSRLSPYHFHRFLELILAFLLVSILSSRDLNQVFFK